MTREIRRERGGTHGGPKHPLLRVAKSMSSFRVIRTQQGKARLMLSCQYQTQEGSLPGEVHSRRLSPNQRQISSKDNCVIRRHHALHTCFPQRVNPNTRALAETQPLDPCHTEAVSG